MTSSAPLYGMERLRAGTAERRRLDADRAEADMVRAVHALRGQLQEFDAALGRFIAAQKKRERDEASR